VNGEAQEQDRKGHDDADLGAEGQDAAEQLDTGRKPCARGGRDEQRSYRSPVRVS
jgi:hypothetical protein